MPTLVIDSSVTLSLAFADEFDDYAARAFDTVRRSGALVPALWHLEVANILASGVRRERLTRREAERFLSLLATLPITTAEENHTFPAAELFDLAQNRALTAYDAAYLRLALATGLPLASRDKELNAAAQSAGIPLFS